MTTRPLYLMDTHALYWRRLGSPKLSRIAAATFHEGIAGKAVLIVHHVAIAELFYILQKQNQIPLFAPMLQDYQTFPYDRIEPIELIDLERLGDVPEIPEMHDRLLAVAAKRLGATIVTRDPVIQASTQVRSLW
ncbi:MAG: PIN domain-containing protein [Isosphaeraceae bacterium]